MTIRAGKLFEIRIRTSELRSFCSSCLIISVSASKSISPCISRSRNVFFFIVSPSFTAVDATSFRPSSSLKLSGVHFSYFFISCLYSYNTQGISYNWQLATCKIFTDSSTRCAQKSYDKFCR